MVNESNKITPLYSKRINMNNDRDVIYWTGRFGCTSEELRAAVDKVGEVASEVSAELKKKRNRRKS